MTNRAAKSEPTIATKTLRSHPWHDVHSITHRQMAETAPSGKATVQHLHTGVRCANVTVELLQPRLGDCWMAGAIGAADPFQSPPEQTA
jgi:hypothetical protein